MIVRPVLVEVAAAIGWIAVAAGDAVRAGDRDADGHGHRPRRVVRLVLDGRRRGLAGGRVLRPCSCGSSAPAPTSPSRPACCGSSPGRSPTPRWTVSCSSSWTACRSPSCTGCCSPGRCRRCGAGSTTARHARSRVDRPAAVHDAGQPAGDPAGQRRRRPGLPVVRPRPGAGPGGQPARGRLDHRVAGEHRARPARRRRRLDLQPLHRRRPEGRHDHEPAGGVARVAPHAPGVRALPDPARRPGAQLLPDDGRDRPGAVPGDATAAAGRASAGAPLLDVRRPASLQQLPAARPEHRRGERGDDAGRPQHLRRLRRLRRDRAPRRGDPDRVAGRARRPRPGGGDPGEGGAASPAEVPPGPAQRPRAVAG